MYLKAFLDYLDKMRPQKFSRGLEFEILAWTGAQIFGVAAKKYRLGGGEVPLPVSHV